MAATLAQRGFTAEEAILEAPQGIADAFCLEGEIDWEALTRDLGKRYALEGGAVTKVYPCCNPAHRPIEALLRLAREYGFQADDVDRIECDPHGFSLRRHEAQDGQTGQYSLEYCLSVALIDGRVGLDQMTDERVRAPDVQALMRRLQIVPLKEGALSRHGRERLTVYLRDGQSRSVEIDRVPRFTTAKEIEAKFFECALRAIPGEVATRLQNAILNLENLPDITPLMEDAGG
jgi:2-methylcitrate dehydratase PrpD